MQILSDQCRISVMPSWLKKLNKENGWIHSTCAKAGWLCCTAVSDLSSSRRCFKPGIYSWTAGLRWSADSSSFSLYSRRSWIFIPITSDFKPARHPALSLCWNLSISNTVNTVVVDSGLELWWCYFPVLSSSFLLRVITSSWPQGNTCKNVLSNCKHNLDRHGNYLSRRQFGVKSTCRNTIRM